MDGPRACELSDVESSIELINKTFREETGQDIRTDYPLVYDSSMLEFRRIIKIDNKVVAHVPIAPRLILRDGDQIMSGLISATVTHPDYRKQGLGTLCLEDCVRIMHQRNWPMSILWTLEPTFPFYQNSDWEAVGSQGFVYKLTEQDSMLFNKNSYLKIIEYDKDNNDHLDGIMRIHDAEPIRISRSITDYQILFDLPKSKTILAFDDSNLIAYLTFGWSTNKPGIIESGGLTEGIESLIKYFLENEMRDKNTQALVPLHKTTMGELLNSKKPKDCLPIEKAQGMGYQMNRINYMEVLLKSMYKYFQIKSINLNTSFSISLKDTNETVGISLNKGKVEISNHKQPRHINLSRRNLTQLIFGTHHKISEIEIYLDLKKIFDSIFPYRFTIWPLDKC